MITRTQLQKSCGCQTRYWKCDARGGGLIAELTDAKPHCAQVGNRPDMLATTGDYLRLWEVNYSGGGGGGSGRPDSGCSVSMMKLLNNNKNSEFCAPLTSFDWNDTDPSIIGTSSIDTTCTIWNVETGQAKTQLIAHDKEVYDIAFACGTEVFASVGADGSVRLFDLRSLEHSTIIYESAPPPDSSPLLRLAWNKQDTNYLATFVMDSSALVILDIRVPSIPVAELHGHDQSVNALAWAPHSHCHICSAGDDAQVPSRPPPPARLLLHRVLV